MNNLAKRLLLAGISIPALLLLIFILPFQYHLVLNILIVGLSVIGGMETRNLFSNKNIVLNKYKVAFISAVFPVYSILLVNKIIPEQIIVPLLAFSISIMFTREALVRDKGYIKSVIERLPAYCFLLIFPGFFMSFLIRLNMLERPSVLIFMFLTFVFGNDSFAYFAGMLFGKNNRGIFAVSPKKSIAGLIGGLASAGIAGFLFSIFFPDVFNDNPVYAVLIGIAIGLTSVIGDLLESALKRSADQKDSGTLMGGRGGVLDSIDSILFSAPLYYYIMFLLQN